MLAFHHVRNQNAVAVGIVAFVNMTTERLNNSDNRRDTSRSIRATATAQLSVNDGRRVDVLSSGCPALAAIAASLAVHVSWEVKLKV